MAIPVVARGMIMAEGKVFELDSPSGSTWLDLAVSFRFEPIGQNKPYTVRRETGKKGDYWYGYRKVAGQLHKKYVGKTSEIDTAKLDEIAEALNTRSQSRVTDKVTQQVTDGDRLTALELQVRTLQETLEALIKALSGKLGEGLCNRLELPNPNREVTDNELQTAIGNLRVENEALKADYSKLLESSTHVTAKLREEVRQLRSQVQAERIKWEELREELDDRPEIQKSVLAVADFPEPSDLLNQLRTRRKKSRADLADVEVVLEILSYPEE